MSKIFKRIRELYLKNKDDIKTSIIVSLAMILVLLIIFIILLASMCSDLVDRVQDQEYAIQEMTVDLNYQSSLIQAFQEREERCRNGEDIGDDEFSIICIQK